MVAWIFLPSRQVYFLLLGFLTAILQNHSRRMNLPIDTLLFSYEVTGMDSSDFADEIDNTDAVEDGVLLKGLYMEGARWDRSQALVKDSFPMEMFNASVY